jgi:predicted AlkP superfamily phosphohydrolase/phosphomutase
MKLKMKTTILLLVTFTIFFSDCKPKKEPSRTDLTAYFSQFPAEIQTEQAEIRLSQDQPKVMFKGPLTCFFFLRTHENPEMAFRIQRKGATEEGNTLEILFENYLGEKKTHKIPLKSEDSKKENIDLSHFKNQVLKVSFFHHSESQVETEIEGPILNDMVTQGKRKKVMLLGLDGAAWDVINPMIKEGKLPTLEKLINSGVSGPLRSVRPMYSPLIWTSMLTGKVKEKHGITGFVEQQEKKGEIIPNSRLNRKCLAIWNILSAMNYSVGIVGPWVSWPAESVNGYLLTDRITFKKLPDTSFPPELQETTGINIEFLADQAKPPLLSEIEELLNPEELILRSPVQKNIKQEKIYLKQDNLKRAAGLYFNEIFQPDFFFLYLRGPDVTSHFFWKYYEPDETVPEKEVEAFQDIIPKVYQYQDYVVGQYLEKAGEDTIVIIVSDHGMGKKSYTPNVGIEKIGKLWKKIGVEKFIENTAVRRNQIELSLVKNADSKAILDRVLRLSWRTPEGSVAIPGSPRRYTPRDDGLSPLFTKSKEKARDSAILLEIKNYFTLDGNASVSYKNRSLGKLDDYLSIRELSGDHILHGVLILSGPGIKENHRLKEYSVLDITPTVLHLLGLAVGKDMDGDVIEEAFTEDLRAEAGVKFIESYEGKISQKSTDKKIIDINKEQEKKLLERLKSLGYIK